MGHSRCRIGFLWADGVLIAWPVTYGASGMMTFEVNQDAVVFQKDLGPATVTIAPEIRVFNPDPNWARVDIVGP
jgi:hypothetical protein